MFNLRDFLIFLAGGEFLHALSHLFLSYFVKLPLDMNIMVLTSQLNTWAIILNGVATVLLLVVAARMKR